MCGLRLNYNKEKMECGQCVYFACMAIAAALEYAIWAGVGPELSFGGKVIIYLQPIIRNSTWRMSLAMMAMTAIACASGGLLYSMFEYTGGGDA